MFQTPILYLVFNRPDLVERSFQILKRVKPKELYIAADGPREDNQEDKVKCEAVRTYIQANVDWDCDVKLLFRDKNLGCGIAISEAITWFFDQVDDGIILEDDCLPDLSFFTFCDQMLKQYRNNKSVYQISGSNWQRGILRGDGDYYFSHLSSVWGWATWKDRWADYKFSIEIGGDEWKKVEQNLKEIASSREEEIYHLSCIEKTEKGEIDTWDYQWRYLLFLKRGLNIVPNTNLVSNIGHRDDGTHTTNMDHWRSELPAKSISLNLKHPKDLKISYEADKYLADHIWLYRKNLKTNRNILSKLKRKAFEFFIR